MSPADTRDDIDIPIPIPKPDISVPRPLVTLKVLPGGPKVGLTPGEPIPIEWSFQVRGPFDVGTAVTARFEFEKQELETIGPVPIEDFKIKPQRFNIVPPGEVAPAVYKLGPKRIRLVVTSNGPYPGPYIGIARFEVMGERNWLGEGWSAQWVQWHSPPQTVGWKDPFELRLSFQNLSRYASMGKVRLRLQENVHNWHDSPDPASASKSLRDNYHSVGGGRIRGGT